MAKFNNYKSTACGMVYDNAGQKLISRARVAGQIMKLSYSTISQEFGGVIGKGYIDAIRYAMISELDACARDLSSWREIAGMVKAREELHQTT